MKTIEQLEKEFDDKTKHLLRNARDHHIKIYIKNYIFQELLPQVLSEILIEEDNRGMKWGSYGMKKFNSIETIKQKAKEMGIKL